MLLLTPFCVANMYVQQTSTDINFYDKVMGYTKDKQKAF